MLKSNKSGYKGVYINKTGKYVAQISIDGKNHNLGCFSNILEAVKLRDLKAKELNEKNLKKLYFINLK